MISQQTSGVVECSLALHADMFSTPEKNMETAGTHPSERRTLPLRRTPQVTRKRDRPFGTWRRTVEKEAASVGRVRGLLTDLVRHRTEWRALLDFLCFRQGATGIMSSKSRCVVLKAQTWCKCGRRLHYYVNPLTGCHPTISKRFRFCLCQRFFRKKTIWNACKCFYYVRLVD